MQSENVIKTYLVRTVNVCSLWSLKRRKGKQLGEQWRVKRGGQTTTGNIQFKQNPAVPFPTEQGLA